MEFKAFILSCLIIGSMMALYTYFILAIDSEVMVEFYDKVFK